MMKYLFVLLVVVAVCFAGHVTYEEKMEHLEHHPVRKMLRKAQKTRPNLGFEDHNHHRHHPEGTSHFQPMGMVSRVATVFGDIFFPERHRIKFNESVVRLFRDDKTGGFKAEKIPYTTTGPTAGPFRIRKRLIGGVEHIRVIAFADKSIFPTLPAESSTSTNRKEHTLGKTTVVPDKCSATVDPTSRECYITVFLYGEFQQFLVYNSENDGIGSQLIKYQTGIHPSKGPQGLIFDMWVPVTGIFRPCNDPSTTSNLCSDDLKAWPPSVSGSHKNYIEKRWAMSKPTPNPNDGNPNGDLFSRKGYTINYADKGFGFSEYILIPKQRVVLNGIHERGKWIKLHLSGVPRSDPFAPDRHLREYKDAYDFNWNPYSKMPRFIINYPLNKETNLNLKIVEIAGIKYVRMVAFMKSLETLPKGSNTRGQVTLGEACEDWDTRASQPKGCFTRIFGYGELGLWMARNGISKVSDLTQKRFNGLLGKKDGAWTKAVDLYVKFEDIFRACWDTNIETDGCPRREVVASPTYIRWFQNFTARQNVTGDLFSYMGYTYDYMRDYYTYYESGPYVVGLSEYYTKPRSTVFIANVRDTPAFFQEELQNANPPEEPMYEEPWKLVGEYTNCGYQGPDNCQKGQIRLWFGSHLAKIRMDMDRPRHRGGEVELTEPSTQTGPGIPTTIAASTTTLLFSRFVGDFLDKDPTVTQEGGGKSYEMYYNGQCKKRELDAGYMHEYSLFHFLKNTPKFGGNWKLNGRDTTLWHGRAFSLSPSHPGFNCDISLWHDTEKNVPLRIVFSGEGPCAGVTIDVTSFMTGASNVPADLFSVKDKTECKATTKIAKYGPKGGKPVEPSVLSVAGCTGGGTSTVGCTNQYITVTGTGYPQKFEDANVTFEPYVDGAMYDEETLVDARRVAAARPTPICEVTAIARESTAADSKASLKCMLKWGLSKGLFSVVVTELFSNQRSYTPFITVGSVLPKVTSVKGCRTPSSTSTSNCEPRGVILEISGQGFSTTKDIANMVRFDVVGSAKPKLPTCTMLAGGTDKLLKCALDAFGCEGNYRVRVYVGDLGNDGANEKIDIIVPAKEYIPVYPPDTYSYAVKAGSPTDKLSFRLERAPTKPVTFTPAGEGLIFQPAKLEFTPTSELTKTTTMTATKEAKVGMPKIKWSISGDGASEVAGVPDGQTNIYYKRNITVNTTVPNVVLFLNGAASPSIEILLSDAPRVELIITPATSGLTVTPTTDFKFGPGQTSKLFTVSAAAVGEKVIKFTLSGRNAADYNNIKDLKILVRPKIAVTVPAWPILVLGGDAKELCFSIPFSPPVGFTITIAAPPGVVATPKDVQFNEVSLGGCFMASAIDVQDPNTAQPQSENAPNDGQATVTYSVSGANGNDVNAIAPSTVTKIVKASAGEPQNICSDTVVVTGSSGSLNLARYEWKVLKGKGVMIDTTTAITKVTQLGVGQLQLQYRVYKDKVETTSTTIVTRAGMPSIANAGADIEVPPTGLGVATVNAVEPTVGSGTWSSDDASIVFENATSPKTKVSGLQRGVNVVRWTVANPPCPTNSDTVSITWKPQLISVPAKLPMVYMGAKEFTSPLLIKLPNPPTANLIIDVNITGAAYDPQYKGPRLEFTSTSPKEQSFAFKITCCDSYLSQPWYMRFRLSGDSAFEYETPADVVLYVNRCTPANAEFCDPEAGK